MLILLVLQNVPVCKKVLAGWAKRTFEKDNPMAARPYFDLLITQLEALFAEHRDSPEILTALRDELQLRSKPKARQLLAKIESLLAPLDALVATEGDHGRPDPAEENEVAEGGPSGQLSEFPPIPRRTEAKAVTSVPTVGGAVDRRRSAILEYWRAVEIFSPQQVPRVEPRSPLPVYECPHGQTGPWEAGHFHLGRRPPEKCLWRYVVYGGIYPTKLISSKLEGVFGKDPETFDERVDGSSAVFAIALTHKGEPLIESFVLSSAAWALGRLQYPGPEDEGWLHGFEGSEANIRAYLEERFVEAAGDDRSTPPIGRPLAATHLVEVCRRVLEYLGLDGEEFSLDMVVRCQPVFFQRYKNTDDVDVLNSFFFRDLHRVARAASFGECGPALAAYLDEPGVRELSRVDARRQDPLEFCWDKLAVAKFPRARWPGAGHHPLVYSQQVAVNELLGMLGNGHGLFGINGPPGTGKTTLLRDVVADVITQRAVALSSLAHPQRGFQSHENWTSGAYTRRINLIAESLCGFDMVVASANNGAVENVTLELPGANAIDSSWRPGEDHFSEFASRLLGAPAWGLIAARLGNKANRREFLSRFWFGEADEAGESRDGFLDYLREREAEATVTSWSAAVRRFQDSLKEESRIRDERAAAWKSVLELSELQKRHEEQTTELKLLEEKIRELHSAHQRAHTCVLECERVLADSKRERLEHLAFRPPWWTVLFTFGRAYREWRAQDMVYEQQVESARQSLASAQNGLQLCDESLGTTAYARDACSTAIYETKARLQRVNNIIEQSKSNLGAHFCYDLAWVESEESRELSSPWMDPIWARARTQVFFAALHLHREFVHANALQFRQNLTALSDVLSGTLPGAASAKAVKAAWNALFFVTPVVSTTFASIDRLFPFHEQDSIGWLFVDEAGQTTPQAAAGALWRSRRAVVVGDPLQLEPILSLPFTAQDSLSRHFGVAGHWRPGSLSCQRLADEASKLGTWLPSDAGPLWVGSPLRVHRRCDALMFEVSNRVAYDGMMIFGTPPRPESLLPSSRWIDVLSAESSDSHWIPEEGKAARQLLSELVSSGALPQDIFLISPFRAVVRELSNFTRDFGGIRSGTIHTVQGKEADIVILVLGGNPLKGGAKDWAAAKPNLINVAASRARRRLYVIGNRAEWKKRRYFSTLSTVFEQSAGT